jgi:predicted ATP-dependent endonuclease of OLD family
MKLLAFNIQNYRSIVNSGWSNLAHDNITALIGQNESGKTSVLEALQSFYDGIIYEDILRSDLSLPLVHCKFDLNKKSVVEMLDKQKIPTEIYQILNTKKGFSLTRKWNEQRKSIVFISDEEIMNYYEIKELEKAQIEEKTRIEIDNLLRHSDDVFQNIIISEQEKDEALKSLSIKRKQLDEEKKVLKKSRTIEAKLITENKLTTLISECNFAEENLRQKQEKFENYKQKTEELSEKVSVCKACNETIKQFFETKNERDQLRAHFREAEHHNSLVSSKKDKKSTVNKLQKLKRELEICESRYLKVSQDMDLFKAISIRVLEGQNFRQAETESKKELDKEKNYYSIYEIGAILFEHIPEFEFFEDFSSLLPNKIDLEDILNENIHAEGYKAARNFLQIAGLNAEFFRERNHRILKQKIENLNGEITIDFQDFWSQNIGRDNKIRINFELEHYDFTHPEKSGKPYLEFWIKDKLERLYPKQRSRGVRWFLSFYLELKAMAKMDSGSRIMLIDEPGLSLHARAQEDVLKVFEDLKEKMQIIYCTHSPHLIDLNKLYRILPVQRANEYDDHSETVILNADLIYSASSDTLSPVYSLMGVKINNQNFIHPVNNIIVEDTVCYYYLNAIYKLSGESIIPSFIPSTGLTNIMVLSNILLGWKVGFSILLMGITRSNEIANDLEKSFFIGNEKEKAKRILKLDKIEYPEDLFSTLDFKKFVLQKRVGITEKNSDFIAENNLSRTILASQFLNCCETRNISFNDLDDDSRKNINLLITKIKEVLT